MRRPCGRGSRSWWWAAGVKPAELDAALDVPRTRSRRIAADAYLRIPECPGAFAIGDVAGAIQDGRELAMMSPQAMQEGRYVAGAIVWLEGREPLRPFRYRDKGVMATIGRQAAVAQVGPLAFKGATGCSCGSSCTSTSLSATGTGWRC